jgi:hypothetical protein
MSKRKRDAVNNIVNNITINNYFAPKSPEPQHPARVVEGVAAPEEKTEPNLFPIHEQWVMAQMPNHKNSNYDLARSTSKGSLLGGCSMCKVSYRCPIEHFAPPDNHQNHRRRAAFDAAVAAYGEAYARRDLEAARAARADVVATRNGKCQSCQEAAGQLSLKQQACKDEWERMRKEADGCANADCRERGPHAWQVLQANHLDPKTKVYALSNYPWWAKKEWTVDQCVAEMRKEAAKCNFLCGFCHALDENGKQANRHGDPDAMPPGKRSGTEEEVAQYKAKHAAGIRFPKQQFVDAEKLRRGCCANPACRRAVTPETCVAFHFDHRDERTKMKGKDTLAGKVGGVAGLVHNHAKRAALDVVYDSNGKITYDDQGFICVRDNEFKGILVAEMDKCDLLCHNCHHRKTRYDGPGGESDE